MKLSTSCCIFFHLSALCGCLKKTSFFVQVPGPLSPVPDRQIVLAFASAFSMATWKWWIATPSSMWRSCPLTPTRRCWEKRRVFWCFLHVLFWYVLKIIEVTVCWFRRDYRLKLSYYVFLQRSWGLKYILFLLLQHFLFRELDSNWAILFWSYNTIMAANRSFQTDCTCHCQALRRTKSCPAFLNSEETLGVKNAMRKSSVFFF